MKQYVLLFYMTFLLRCAYGQISVYQSPDVLINREVYEQDTIEMFGHSLLYLGEDEYVFENCYKYYLNFEFKHNQPRQIRMSYGKYIMEGDDIIMIDSVSGFSMRAVKEDSETIVFRDCFAPLKGLLFSYNQTVSDSLMGDRTKVVPALPVKEMCETYRVDNSGRKIKLGVYSDNIYLKLDLERNGRYVYYYDKKVVPLSVGTWKQYGMLLTLQDDGLDMPFYAFVDDNFVNVEYLPGAFYTRDFEYVKYDPSEEEKALPAIRGDSIFACFSVDMPEHTYISIVFSENEYYMSHAVWTLNDVAMQFELSYGGFTREGNMLYLADSVCGFEMQFELSDDTTRITQRRGFSALNDKDLAFEGKAWEAAPASFDRDLEEDKQMFSAYASQDQLFSYGVGLYAFNRGVELRIFGDESFTYQILGTVYLEGRASREGNLLILKDNVIEEPFYALIEEDGIVPILPGLYGRQKAIAEIE